MAVPGKGNEEVGGKQHKDRQDRRRNGGHQYPLEYPLGPVPRANIRYGPRFIGFQLTFDFKNAKALPYPSTTASGWDRKKPPQLEISGTLTALFREAEKQFREATRRRMQLDWRAISGPALTTATALTAFFVDRHIIAVPNPAPLFVRIVA